MILFLDRCAQKIFFISENQRVFDEKDLRWLYGHAREIFSSLNSMCVCVCVCVQLTVYLSKCVCMFVFIIARYQFS